MNLIDKCSNCEQPATNDIKPVWACGSFQKDDDTILQTPMCKALAHSKLETRESLERERKQETVIDDAFAEIDRLVKEKREGSIAHGENLIEMSHRLQAVTDERVDVEQVAADVGIALIKYAGQSVSLALTVDVMKSILTQENA